jgi:shikimate dehydrogenase
MKKYGLIGYPLTHSFSKSFFNQKFTSEHIDAEYVNFEIANINEFKNVLKQNSDLNGINVTIPYKTQVIPFLDELTDNAKAIGAVNVIKLTKGYFGKTKLIGHNTDILGFKQSIEPLLNPAQHKKALILGTGGASKAIFHGLNQLGIESTFVSRTPIKDGLTYEDLTPEIIQAHTVIVNTTPLGMFPHTDACPNIPYEHITKEHLLYDLLYNPDETLFMTKGKQQGAEVKNGLEMLLLQAFAGWKIWNE